MQNYQDSHANQKFDLVNGTLISQEKYLKDSSKQLRNQFNATFHNGGFNLTMPEQDDFIGVLRGVPLYVNSNNVGQPYTSYVPFVLKLFPGHIKDYNMVS